MNLDRCLVLTEVSLIGATSWIFLLSLVVKVASTIIGLARRRHAGNVASVPGGIWWASKLSALILCLTAAILCTAVGDVAGQFVFGVLLAVAAVMVATLAAKRHRSANTQSV